MSELSDHLEDYLRLRRRLGFVLAGDGRVLAQFVDYLREHALTSITTQAAIEFARLPRGVDPVNWSHRLGAIRGFARYLATIDPSTEIPPSGVFPGQGKRPAPYLYTDAEIRAILHAASELQPVMRAATMHTLLGLLAVTGLRIGEALRLLRTDVDLRAGVLTVAGPKTGHPRLVPLHPSTVAQLQPLRPPPRPPDTTAAAIGGVLRLRHRRRADLLGGAHRVLPDHHHRRAAHRHRAAPNS